MVLNHGLNTAISSAIDFGKSAIGIVTGSFENISQIQTAIGKGGLLDSISSLIDESARKAKEKGLISSDIVKAIKTEKKIVINSIENGIENELEKQIKSVKKISEYSEKWNNCYEEKDFDGMENAFRNMNRYLKNTVPLESTLKEARTVENLHTLIKNKGGDFNLTEDEISLAEKLTN